MKYLDCMRAFLAVYLITILFSVGCKNDKAEHPDICAYRHEPGDYFPAFPGSWWSYHNQQNESVKFEISNDYEPLNGHCYPQFLNFNQYALELPIKGEAFLLSAYHGQGSGSYDPSPIYSLIRDSAFICPVAFAGRWFRNVYISYNDLWTYRKTIVLDTTITLSGSRTFSNVIVVKEYYTQWTGTNNFYYNDYFSKNIGLIKRDSIDGIAHDTTQILELEDYFINH